MKSNDLNKIGSTRCFDGWMHTYEHDSQVCASRMRFAVYLPPAAESGPVPALYWLSGLTCTEENFMAKAGAQRCAAELGIALIAPDTSPRGLNLPGEDDDWDFGSGAGFYVNATQAPWADHYNMYDYVVSELPELIEASLPVNPAKKSISGHSMGGHGALTIALKNPGSYQSVSAFSPICAPSQCPWGEKALGNYLGSDRSTWEAYDTTCLVRNGNNRIALLIDQGEADSFLEEQLKPHLLQQVCEEMQHPLTLRIQPGYDHSYFFIATFIEDHLRHHAKALKGGIDVT